MFQGPPRGAGGPPGVPLQQAGPPPGQQPGPPPMQGHAEISARDKLTTYVYEYLISTGATKTAEAFKEEVISVTNPMFASSTKPLDKSFLLDWWLLFWDLWSAAPERRDVTDQAFTPEAKYFHDSMVGMPPMMVNGHFPAPMGMDMMGGHPGAFGGRFQPGRMPPGAMPPAGFPMFPPDPRMQRIPGNAMRMPPPPGAPFPGPPGGMPRPGVPGAPMGDMPGMPRYDFMGPPGQPFPGASGSGMMPNGAMPHMSLNSPSMGPPPGGDPSMPGAFMGMPPNPASSSAMSFGMSDQPMSAGGAAAPGTPGMVAGAAGPGSVPPATSVGSVGTPQQPKPETAAAAPVNGDDMKTEALTPTAAAIVNGGGPGSAPGSAHSANNNVNPGTPGGGPMSNPLSNPMSNPPLSSGPTPGSADAYKTNREFNVLLQDDSEISKIREGLLDGFKTEVTGAWD